MDQNIENNFSENVEVESNESTSTQNQFGEVKSMLNTLKDMCDTCRQTIEDGIRSNYRLSTEMISVNGGILGYTKTDINAMSCEDIKCLLDRYGNSENTSQLLEENQNEDELEEDTYRRILLDIKDYQISLIENERTYTDGITQAQEIADQYQEYLSSDIYIEKRDKYIEELRQAAESETDESKKREMYKKIATFKDSMTLDFLTRRIKDEKIGKKEIKSIVDGFFKIAKGNLVIEKYEAKIEKYGYNRWIYKRFFNLEEMFLPEEYHVFNNLFLYIYMRFVSYSNSYEDKDKSYVKAVTTNIVTLLYHKFANNSMEEEFKSLITGVLDHFKDYYDKFDKENTTHPNHPHALAMRKDQEVARKVAVVNKLKDLNITDYDEDASSEDLYTLLQDKIEEMKIEQAPTHDGETVDVSESDDGEVTIEPRFIGVDMSIKSENHNDDPNDSMNMDILTPDFTIDIPSDVLEDSHDSMLTTLSDIVRDRSGSTTPLTFITIDKDGIVLDSEIILPELETSDEDVSQISRVSAEGPTIPLYGYSVPKSVLSKWAKDIRTQTEIGDVLLCELKEDGEYIERMCFLTNIKPITNKLDSITMQYSGEPLESESIGESDGLQYKPTSVKETLDNWHDEVSQPEEISNRLTTPLTVVTTDNKGNMINATSYMTDLPRPDTEDEDDLPIIARGNTAPIFDYCIPTVDGEDDESSSMPNISTSVKETMEHWADEISQSEQTDDIPTSTLPEHIVSSMSDDTINTSSLNCEDDNVVIEIDSFGYDIIPDDTDTIHNDEEDDE